MRERPIEKYGEIRNVSPEQLEFIVKYYGIVPIDVIASVTGLSRYKVKRIVRKLGLKPVRGSYAKHIVIRFNSEIVIYRR